MDRPLSPRTLLREGKARELAALCRTGEADAVVFRKELTALQRRTLGELCGVPVHDATELGLG